MHNYYYDYYYDYYDYYHYYYHYYYYHHHTDLSPAGERRHVEGSGASG